MEGVIEAMVEMQIEMVEVEVVDMEEEQMAEMDVVVEEDTLVKVVVGREVEEVTMEMAEIIQVVVEDMEMGQYTENIRLDLLVEERMGYLEAMYMLLAEMVFV